MVMANGAMVGSNSLGRMGLSNLQTSGRFRGRALTDSTRFRELDGRQSYYECTQHDAKEVDFDGRAIRPGGRMLGTQPLITAEKIPTYIPLKARRPSSPYRLPRVIVNSFTNLCFGEGRFPRLTSYDEETEDFAQAISKAGFLPVRMIQARNLGGSMGAVGMSWCYVEGRPRFGVHNSKRLFVQKWADRELLVPEHVTEAYMYPEQEWSERYRRMIDVNYWYRRDWTPDGDYVFAPVRDEPGQDPIEIWNLAGPDMKKSVEHNDDLTHFQWIQNYPDDSPDGRPDYDGLYETFDSIDILLSVITKGAILNLDPTVKLKMDRDEVGRFGFRKGSENSIVTGKDGDASYMELGGSSIDAGIKLVNEKRRYALETASCVVPDPNEVASQGASSVTLRMVYAPMLGRGEVFREQYGTGMSRLLEGPLVIARKKSKSRVVIINDEGEEQEAQAAFDLPQRAERKPVIDEESGLPTGEETIERNDRTPGEGELELQWPAWFSPTPQDQQLGMQTLTTATGGQPVMSSETGTELAMQLYGREHQGEWAKIQAQQNLAEQRQGQMFGDEDGSVGGKVMQTSQLPGGATVKRTAKKEGEPEEVPENFDEG